ncbi:interleukin-17 receptor C [Polymixia lowei]
MVSPGLSIGCIILTQVMSMLAVEVIRYDSQEVFRSKFCSQGLSNCTIKDEILGAPEPKSNAVGVSDLKTQARLCCKDRAPCTLCLEIDTQLYIHPNSGRDEDDDSEGTGNQRAASVKVCYEASIGQLPVCKRVEFTVNLTALNQQYKAQLSLVIINPDGVSFSCRVSVSVHPPSLRREVVMPSLDEVCSLDLRERIKECDVPIINNVINQEKNQVELHVVGKNKSLASLMCLQYERNGKCQSWNRMALPLYSVTTCTCLQAWWDAGNQRSRRSINCPFINQTEVFQGNVWNNVSMSVVLVQMNKVLLLWNLSAPCRLEAEVWPCHRTTGVRQNRCKEIKGLRQQLSTRTWRQNSNERWEIDGVFEDINFQLSPCVMVKVNGMQNELGPFCINDIDRWRWSLLVVTMVLLICLTVLILYFLHDKIKSWAQSWHYGKCVQPRSGHVVVLSPPDVEGAMPQLVCGLGSRLCDHGFSVSVDQWSRADQCSLGPLPWLHSQLLRLDDLGGRVILVLTRKASERTEEWTRQYRDAQGKAEDKDFPQASSPYSDVFAASLRCIAAEKQLGRSGERFLLVNFESYPARPPCGDRSLPELLRGLPLFHLPSQIQALLTELAGGRRRRGSGCRRWTERKRGPSGGWAAGIDEKLDKQRTPLYKCPGVESETLPLKQQPSNKSH